MTASQHSTTSAAGLPPNIFLGLASVGLLKMSGVWTSSLIILKNSSQLGQDVKDGEFLLCPAPVMQDVVSMSGKPDTSIVLLAIT